MLHGDIWKWTSGHVFSMQIERQKKRTGGGQGGQLKEGYPVRPGFKSQSQHLPTLIHLRCPSLAAGVYAGDDMIIRHEPFAELKLEARC